MTNTGVFMRLLTIVLVLAGIASIRGSYDVHSQTASVDDALTSFNFEEKIDTPAIWYDDGIDDAYIYDDDIHEYDQYGYRDTPTYYYDEVWEYYDEPVRTYAPSYTTYVSPSSQTSYTYTTVVPLGGSVGGYTAPTVSTPSTPIRVQPVSFDIVPLGVPVGGVQQAQQTTAQPSTYQASFGTPTYVAPLPAAPAAPLPSCALYATPAVAGGGNIVFRWSTVNAIAATLSNVGTVPLQSTYYPISAPVGSYTYVLTVQDAYGRTAQCAAATQAIIPQQIGYKKPWCSIVAQPTVIVAGQSATISWASTNTTSASLTDVGAVGAVGASTVSPATSRVYTLNIYGPGGSDSCSTYLTVESTRAIQPEWPKAPTCSLNADPATVFPGGSTALRWNAARATSASLSGLGAVSTAGTTTVSPTTTTTYVLTVKGDGGTKTCRIDVAVQSVASCTVTCGGVTYACAPSATPVGVQCPATAAESGGFWSWLTGLFH